MSGSDDSILSRLVELDQKACAMVEDAQEVLESTLSNAERDTARFREEYTRKAMERVGIVRNEESSASEAELKSISQRYQTLMDGLEKTYRERHALWEEEIYQRCIRK